MRKITIIRERCPNGRRWSIENWDDYLAYLEANGLRKPAIRFGIFADLETEREYRAQIGEFEHQIPLVYQLTGGGIEYQIVDA